MHYDCDGAPVSRGVAFHQTTYYRHSDGNTHIETSAISDCAGARDVGGLVILSTTLWGPVYSPYSVFALIPGGLTVQIWVQGQRWHESWVRYDRYISRSTLGPAFSSSAVEGPHICFVRTHGQIYSPYAQTTTISATSDLSTPTRRFFRASSLFHPRNFFFVQTSPHTKGPSGELIQEGNEKRWWSQLHVGAAGPDKVYAQNFRHPLWSQDWNGLEILELILQQPHTVQTIMSSENTPILAGTIPAFELFMSSWKAMLDDPVLEKESIARIIKPGLNLAEKYYDKFGDTDAYIISMFINPSIRFEWIRKNWSYEDQEHARKAAIKYRNVQQALDFSTPTASTSREEWGVEDEMNSYIQSPIPSPQTTDMIGYWTVRLSPKHLLSA
ncbi:hypothetical protein B0H11DRAFT_1932569 [Mycena galericulata]|nr:hypothetical protein B0H11DRAFT_1932569 [Mycena galericulata]